MCHAKQVHDTIQQRTTEGSMKVRLLQCQVAPRVQTSTDCASKSNCAHITSWNVDLVEWHKNKNCILKFVHEYQSIAVEAASNLEVVQNPLA